MEETIRVTEGGERLDRFLVQHFPRYSRVYLQGLIGRGCVLVGGKTRPADARLDEGDVVEVRWPRCAWPEAAFEDWVLFEDRDILVLNKPAGLLMHPVGESWLKVPAAATGEAEPNLAGLLALHRAAIVDAGTPRCGLVHRLDRETSGVLVVAKNRPAQEFLVEEFASRRVEKTYRAVVRGGMSAAVEVQAPIGRRPGRRRIEVTSFGKPSSTFFKTLETISGASLIEAQPKTGRTHQIRAHLAHVGNPVMGDPEFARAARSEAPGDVPSPPRMMLHAYRLVFRHPNGRTVRFSAPVPADFRGYWKRVRGLSQHEQR